MSDLVTSENDILNKLEQGEQIEVIVSSIPENKLKQMPLISLVIKMFKNNISWIFIFNIIINIALSSMLIPTLFKFSNDEFIKNININTGVIFIIIAISSEIISRVHKNCIIEQNKRKFTAKVHCDLEQEVNKNIVLINWNKLRELNKNELDRKKDMAKWYILGLITNIISTFINLFSFFGYTFWICVISPSSLIIYSVLMALLLIFYPYKEKNKNESRQEFWNKYFNLQTGLYTDIIHHNGEKSLNGMKKCMESIESCRDEDKKSDALFTDTIDIIFNIGFIINCLLFANLLSPGDIIIYIQYTCLMRNSVSMCFGIYSQYKEAKREYAKLEDVISKSNKKIQLEQKVINKKITISSLQYVYPTDSNTSNLPFTLMLEDNQKLEFTLGEIIKLEGDSGNGKSTFSDIINAIIPYTEYSSSVYLDDAIKIDGFDCLSKSRYYNEQQESICWQPSIYEIISNKEEINVVDEEIVWHALTITSCLDFVKRENITNELKWIHTKNTGLSGGQKGRISIARAIYRIITTKPKFITLDEVDRAIQSELVVDIMKNIYKYARKNNILVFVICHNPDVKKLDEYNQTIRFVKGMIKKI
jgi:ABC-type bacteriocin/lantibiotic exporter with double-glycine peptidase domain